MTFNVDAPMPAAANSHSQINQSSIAPGSTVIVRDEEWLVTGIEPTTDGSFVHVLGLSGIVQDTEAIFSTAIDRIQTLDPKETKVRPDTSPKFRSSKLWLESTIRRTPVPIGQPRLTVAEQGLIDPLPYQTAAVRQALDPRNLRPRILLADAVGLGKTIEIGMILSELARRGRGDRILIVTPKHVLEQMQFEMWTRFALPFVRLDSAGIQRIRQQLPAGRNPFTYYKRVIISIDTLKSDQYIPHLRRQRWDAVVIDESHNVTNQATHNNRLATLLAHNTDALILASATPHNGRAESFAELIRMLEPSAVHPDGSINEELAKRLIIRRHRHSPEVASIVGSDWAERLEPENREVAASAIENEIAQELEGTWLWPPAEARPTKSSLFPWTLAKAFLSSPAALAESLRNRLNLVRNEGGDSPRELHALERLQELNNRALVEPSAKYQALLAYLKDIGVARNSMRRAVVFAERVPTLKWLEAKLAEDLELKDGQVRVLHGGLSDVEQQEIVESFKLESSPIRLLITGDVASEGVNLHTQCNHLIHYDIPWSLIRIEQRNGRIDRYGQRHRPQILTLLLNPDTERFAGDIRVLTRLVQREHEAHKALGDSASLMGTYDVKAEEDAILDVIRGRKQFDDVVRTPDEVQASTAGSDLIARLLAMGTASSSVDDDASPLTTNSEETSGTRSHNGSVSADLLYSNADAVDPVGVSGLYDQPIDFLRDGLSQAYETPGAALGAGGVQWQERTNYAFASLAPPKDLQQRLRVLPQSYLAERRVTENLQLATAKERGLAELTQARSGDSTSVWPEAHYLSPLHPVLDWTADRVLATLKRGEVFAVYGDVDLVTVLLQRTLTNRRGQLVASSYLTAQFLASPVGGSGAPPMLEVFDNARASIATLQLATTNTRAVANASDLQPFIRAAVAATESSTADQVEAIKRETSALVAQWQERTSRWQRDAEALIQREALKRHTVVVRKEQQIAQEMMPQRTLVRPLLVVVPPDYEPEPTASLNQDSLSQQGTRHV